MSVGRDVSLAIFITSIRENKVLRLLLTASSTSGDLQAWGWRLMWPKKMKNLAAFSAREAKRAVAEE